MKRAKRTGLDYSDRKVLRESNHRRGYGHFKASALDSDAVEREWESCLKLAELGLIVIEGNGEAEDFYATAKGKAVLRGYDRRRQSKGAKR